MQEKIGRLKKLLPITLIIASIFFHRLATLPRLNYLASDPANIAIFAAGKDYETFFSKDPVLSDSKNYSWYIPLYVQLIRWLSKLFNGNYALAFWSQIDVSMFFYGLGCYLFGRDFIGGRKFGILFLLMNLAFIPASWGGGWGMPLNQTRPFVLFISLLPMLLWAGWKLREKKRGHLYYYLILSLSVYIHPPSAVFWIFAIWTTDWILNLDKSPGSLISRQLQSLAVIFLAITPYIIIFSTRYVDSFGNGDTYELLYNIAKYRVNDLAFRPLYYPLKVWLEYPILLKIISILSIAAVIYLKRKNSLFFELKVCILWCLNFLFIGSAIPIIQNIVCEFFKKLPYSYDFARSYMFFPFIFYTIFLLSYRYFEKNYLYKIFHKNLFAAAVYIFVTLWISTLYFPKSVYPVFQGFTRGEMYLRPVTYGSNFVDLLVKATTVKGETICHFPGSTSALSIRYDAKRPLLYCYKDGGTLLYGNPKKAIDWYHTSMEIQHLKKMVKDKNYLPTTRGSKLISWADSLQANFLMISGYKNTLFDFGKYRTIQCHRNILVDLRNGVKKGDVPAEKAFGNISPDGQPIELTFPVKFPEWLKSVNSIDNSAKTSNSNAHLILENLKSKTNTLSYFLKVFPGSVYLLKGMIYYEAYDKDFKITIGEWRAKLYGNKIFSDGNNVLSVPMKWKNYEVLVLIPPEIHPDALSLRLNLLKIRGKGKVMIKDPIIQYIGMYPLADGITINSNS